GRAEPAEAAGPGAEDETTDVDETGPDVEEESEAADDGPSVDEIKGIGPAYSERLAEIDIVTVADLRDADAEEVAERTTAPEGTVQKWIDRANEYE
ncbi:helix-hairpin-helix domain-containing protein, partial [Halolamina salina]|uniref:helix-hairpin-helix domain-containing protein n=1 Tax=Halolamina salina TaxID=1220023 RepID=UPI00361EA0F0